MTTRTRLGSTASMVVRAVVRLLRLARPSAAAGKTASPTRTTVTSAVAPQLATNATISVGTERAAASRALSRGGAVSGASELVS